MRSLSKFLLPTASGLLLCLPGLILAQSASETLATMREANNVAVSTSNLPASNASASSAGTELADLGAELPDSPGAVRTQAQTASAPPGSSSQQSSVPPPSTPASQEALPASSQPPMPANPPAQPPQPQLQQQALPPDSKPQQPAGTAAAEAPVVSGSPVAEPAGVAIAPAKQHRVRTIVIRVGAIVGAGVALGTVFALTEGTSSHPPGAR